MKKLQLLFLLPFITYAQLDYDGELRIMLINTSASWDVTIKLTAASARWDANYNLTENYEIVSSSAINPDIYIDFEHILNPGNESEFAIGLYKISAIENGTEQAYFWMDWRTSDNPDLDVYFNYDVGNNNFRNYENTQIINNTYQTIWNLTPGNLETVGLEDYWDNCLVAIPQKNPSTSVFEPFIIWGPYNDFQPSGYKIYWRRGETGSFTLLQTLNSNTYSFRHENLEVGQGFQTYYKVKAYNSQNESDFTNIANIETSGWYQGYKQSTGTNNSKMLYALEQNYPNPFNPSTVIKYNLPEYNFVILQVYDVLGREMVTLVNEVKEAGIHSVEFNAIGLPSGIYIYKIQTGNFLEIKKMILQK
jgi:hypothetical protein